MNFDTSEFSFKEKFFISLSCIVFLLFIGITDYLTGAELSFSIFYLLPIFAITWFINRGAGTTLSLIGAATWATSDILSHGPYDGGPLVPVWNTSVRLVFFILFTVLLSWVKESWDREKQLSRTDALTGLDNTRSFIEEADEEIERAIRSRHPISVAYMDLDNFKKVNDTLGHTTGDRLLKTVASIIGENIRKIDTASRIGGDEFVIMLPNTDEHGAKTLIDRTREKLSETMRNNNWPVTFSIGIAVFSTPPNSPNDMLKMADELMYQVKKSGKDNVVVKHI